MHLKCSRVISDFNDSIKSPQNTYNYSSQEEEEDTADQEA